MSVTLNAKGTSVSSFAVGKDGTVLTQAGSITPPNGNDLTVVLAEDNFLNIDGGLSGPSLITTTDTKDLHINPAIGGGQYLLLNAVRWPTADGTNGQVLQTNGSGVLSFATLSGTGTVTDVSVATANGFAGSVATSTTTPAITVSTTVTGVLKGNGTAISAATAGTDYSTGTSALATGILKSTTTTGALTIAVAGDFPTLNQNTTGSAATLTTSRSISATGDASWTVNFNGSANATAALTLATVNGSPQTDTFRKVTVNGKGLVTATSAVAAGDITPLINSTYVLKAGDTMTGSLTSPAFIPNTATIPTNGLYLPAANSVGLATNSIERLRIDSTGNVGIGAAPIGSLLLIQGSTGAPGTLDALTLRNSSDGGVGLYFDNAVSTNLASIEALVAGTGSGTDDGVLVLSTATNGTNAERLRIDSVGNVGIATPTPTNYLHIEGTSAVVAATQLTLEGRYAGYGAGISFQSRTSSGGTRVEMARITADGEAAWNTTASTQDAGLNFYTAADGSLTLNARLNTFGNFSIGNSSAGSSTRFYSKGVDTTSSTWSAQFANSAGTLTLGIRNDGAISTGLAASSPYNLTIGSAANAVFNSDGFLYRSTSSLKYKKDVVDYPKGLVELMTLRPVSYKGKGTADGEKIYAGLIAEEVHNAGLTEFVQYAEDNTPDALSYANMVALLVKSIQEQQAEIVSLKARLDAANL